LDTGMPKNLADSVGDVGGLRVATVGRPEASINVLAFLGLRACVDTFELRRLAVLADAWDARVTAADTPGFGHGRARLNGRDRRGLRRGDFTTLARRLVHAARQHNPDLPRRTVTVVGYSLGASVAAAAAAVPGLIRVRHLVLVEPVATRPRNPLAMWRAAHRDNTEVPYGQAVPHSEADIAHLSYALTRGRMTRDLLHAHGIQHFPVQFVHGADSSLARPGDVARLAATCRRAGMDVRDVTVTGGHGLWQSLPDVAAIAALTRQRWTY
jgi:pimeloyl-ACP methyl ester carboxylesterase